MPFNSEEYYEPRGELIEDVADYICRTVNTFWSFGGRGDIELRAITKL